MAKRIEEGGSRNAKIISNINKHGNPIVFQYEEILSSLDRLP
jgi:hypothetical protein